MILDQAAVERLQSLGYSALQASFLWMVALHSGVFLRRQYLHFAASPVASTPLVLWTN